MCLHVSSILKYSVLKLLDRTVYSVTFGLYPSTPWLSKFKVHRGKCILVLNISRETELITRNYNCWVNVTLYSLHFPSHKTQSSWKYLQKNHAAPYNNIIRPPNSHNYIQLNVFRRAQYDNQIIWYVAHLFTLYDITERISHYLYACYISRPVQKFELRQLSRYRG